jgi:hypothetical protein
MKSLARRLAMIRLAFVAAAMAISVSASAESTPMALPDFSIEKSCSMFSAHPRPLALCEDQESRYRGEVTSIWTRAPVQGRERCAGLAGQSERGKYEVLARCLRTSISEVEWKEAVGTIRQQ